MNFKAIAAFLAKNRKLLIIAAVAGIVIYVLATGPRKKITQEVVKGTGSVTAEDRLKADYEALRKKVEELEKDKEKSAKKEDEQEKVKKPGLNTPQKDQEKSESLRELERILKPAQKTERMQPLAPGTASPPAEVTMPLKKQEAPRLLKIDVSEATPSEKKEEKLAKETKGISDLFLPAGSFASFTLTSEAFAPESGPQMPVAGVIDKAFVGPNRSAVPLRGCFFLGKAQGNTGEKIADIKVVKMSCVWPDGNSFEADMTGYVTDRNGDFGMKGEVERHAGTFFGTVGISSFLEGIATGMARSQESTTLGASPYGVQTATNIVGSSAEYGALKGAADFATASKQFFDKQIQNLIPTVVVRAGTRGYLYITSGIRITGGMNALSRNKSYYDSYDLSSSK
ncbi:MAG TPA: hypothetical protein DCP92_17195 [Nitrospiraceae bacterium]|nr:hypothetical protein [Nitrospiraceae bacterium]